MTLPTLLARCLVAVAMLGLPVVALATDHLDIQAELLRPGVRVLAVEFYATWCKPCMEAVPRWKALHDKYRDKGLRLVVVAVQDDGRCVNPGWTPDAMICDEDGRYSRAFKVGDKLPAAFLWSWTGKLLVQRGHVDEVARAVEQELAQVPRVTLTVRRDGPDVKALAEVATLLRSELRKGKKLDVVATKDERAALEQIRRESQKSGYAELSQCKLGEEMAANSLLKAEISRTGREPKLLLQLFSAEQGCLTQSGQGRWRPDEPDASVAEAVADLLGRLRVELQMPGSAGVSRPKAMPTQSGPQASGGQVEESFAKGPVISGGDVSAALGRLIVKATPKEATVQVTGPGKFRELGSAAWERADLQPGRYTVEAAATGYEAQKQTVSVVSDDAQMVKIALQRLGVLEITGTPPGAKVEVRGPDGFSAVQGLPLVIRDARKGSYSVKVSKPGYESVEYNAAVRLGETARLAVALKQPGTLDVRGTPVGAEVKITGPNGFSLVRGLPVKIEGAASGSYKVTVSRDGWATVGQTLVVKSGETAALNVRLVRPAEAQAAAASGPTGDLIAGRYDVRDGGTTVRDLKTKLTWQREVPEERYNWAEAKAYCNALSLAGGGWRLPEKDELWSLVVEGVRPTSDHAAFPNTPDTWFWTATFEGSSAVAWTVTFYYGASYGYDVTNYLRVRCVR